MVAAAALQPGERVLDVGSGRGAVLLPAAAAVGSAGHVDGIDLAPGMVARLGEDIAALPNATITLGDAENPPVQGPYDAVVSGLVLFMLPDPGAALAVQPVAAAGRPARVLLLLARRRPMVAVYAAVRTLVPPSVTPLDRKRGTRGPFGDDDSLTESSLRTGSATCGTSTGRM